MAVVVSSLSILTITTAPTASAALPTGDGISFTLEGCRNNGGISLPDANNRLLCPDGAYTTGNLGKGWNELDRVPVRVTVKAGNSAPATQNFGFALVVDNCSATDGASDCPTGAPGYDLLRADNQSGTPILNQALSSGTCGSISASGPLFGAPGVGGVGTSLYRVLSITGQAKNSLCVYDAWAQLAIGSHLFPGSSLHFNLTDSDLNTGGVGARDVSIPVKEILPQELSKTMDASQGSSFTWRVAKSGPARIDLGDTCQVGGGTGTANITVTWTKSAANPGNITVNTVVSVVNPASRPILVRVVDNTYGNGTKAGDPLFSIDTNDTHPNGVPVPANSVTPVIEDTRDVPAGSSTDGFLSDIATATYIDELTGEALNGQTTDDAVAAITVGSQSQNTAVVTDDEYWSVPNNGITFSVAAPSVGGFTNYTPGTQVGGSTHVLWSSGTVSASGAVTFVKTFTASQGLIGNATLADVATITPTGGAATSDDIDFQVSVNTTVSLQIHKTIPNDLQGNESVTFTFRVKDANDVEVAQRSVTFTAGQSAKNLELITGLAPGSYTITEDAADKYQAQPPQSVTILGDTDANCSATRTFNNAHNLATAKALKVTVPAGSEAGWTFRLNGPGITSPGIPAVTDANGIADFQTQLALEGTYTITEEGRPGWDPTGTSAGCTFTVNYPADADRVFDGCVITNTQRGALTIHKTVRANDVGDTLTGSFSICIQGPSYPSTPNCKTVGIDGGDVSWTNLLPGTYTVTEQSPGAPWLVDITPTSVTVAPGSTGSAAASTVTNTHKGRARVVKTVSANDGSGKVPPSGSQVFTFTLRQGATKYIGNPGTTLETQVANAGNGGQFTFNTLLTPGQHYQLCETLPDTGWTIELGPGQFVPEQFLLNDDVNPGVVNNVYCVDFVATIGPDPTVFTVNNRRPPEGSALTIGYWKNWASCTKSALKKKNSLDLALHAYGSAGLVVSADTGTWPLFGDDYSLVLFAGSNATVATDCAKAVALLNKSNFAGKKMASDPAFNMAAQLVAAQLNYMAGAAHTVTSAINQAVVLLGRYNFTGSTHGVISPADKAAMNALAHTLDLYNNNLL